MVLNRCVTVLVPQGILDALRMSGFKSGFVSAFLIFLFALFTFSFFWGF